MITRGISPVMIEQGDLYASITQAWDRDAFDLMIWRRERGVRGSYQILFGDKGLLDEVFIPEGEPAERPSLSLSSAVAPVFFRLMGQAADQMGVLPDVVSAKIAALETEVKLLREMMARTDKGADAHLRDLRRAADFQED